jgi:hypothetical protein
VSPFAGYEHTYDMQLVRLRDEEGTFLGTLLWIAVETSMNYATFKYKDVANNVTTFSLDIPIWSSYALVGNAVECDEKLVYVYALRDYYNSQIYQMEVRLCADKYNPLNYTVLFTIPGKRNPLKVATTTGWMYVGYSPMVYYLSGKKYIAINISSCGYLDTYRPPDYPSSVTSILGYDEIITTSSEDGNTNDYYKKYGELIFIDLEGNEIYSSILSDSGMMLRGVCENPI